MRSRLRYSVQAWQLNAKDMRKLEAVWCGFLRRMVKGGYARRNAPKSQKDKSIPEEEIDYSYKLSNKDIMSITKTNGIKDFCDMQHFKYIAHVTRLNNNSLQKQFLFSEASKGSISRWKKLSELTSLDESQLRRVMANRLEFTKLLSVVFEQKDSKDNLMRTSVSNREN